MKIGIIELVNPQGTLTTSAHCEILKRLSTISKKLLSSFALLLKPLTYTDFARLTPLNSSHVKFIPSRALKVMIIKVIRDPKPSKRREKVEDSINAAHSCMTGKAIVTQQSQSGYVLVNDDSHVTKNLTKPKDGWIKVVAGRTKVRDDSL